MSEIITNFGGIEIRVVESKLLPPDAAVMIGESITVMQKLAADLQTAFEESLERALLRGIGFGCVPLAEDRLQEQQRRHRADMFAELPNVDLLRQLPRPPEKRCNPLSAMADSFDSMGEDQALREYLRQRGANALKFALAGKRTPEEIAALKKQFGYD